ncbi:disease resistance protein RPS2-like [Typha latifolia]|uniref:disease resistance protein RPS2-like n=1 Tax=Typha latifolia TaxID=4733 RepID=UPI003C2FF531
MELLNGFASVVLSPLFNFVARQLTYPFKAGDNVRELERATGRLLNKKDDVKEKMDISERNGQRQTHQLQGWLNEVETTKTQVDAILEKYTQRGHCFNRFSPNCCSNYTISKAAAKKLLDVQRLLDYETKEEVAITPVPPPVQEVFIPTTSTSSPFANSNIEEALYYIRTDQVVGMIGIWGMGGVGKTHLLRQINNSFIGDSAFNHVILVSGSQSCTTKKLQKEIAKKLKLPLDEDASAQASIVFNFLSKRSFLLLLDDLWGRIDLQEVGIPFPLGVVGGFKRKVVLTTRSTNVCGQMEVRKKIKVECLNDRDAWSLFLEKVGEETINSHPSIQSLAKDVVNELEGLPLAIITIGRAMYEKKDPREWKYAIDLLKKSRLDQIEKQSSEDLEKGIFYTLKFSYNSLKSNTLRECFLSCSMWPEDYSIRKDALIKCWMGLGLIEEFDSMSEAYNIGHTLIGNLIGACLLEPANHLDRSVRMHDVLRDMALWITRDNGKNKNKWIVLRGEIPRAKHMWHEAERITLMDSEIQQLPPIATAPCSSRLTTLMLSCNLELRALGDIGALVALTYLDLSCCGFVHFPKEICVLVQLQYLNLANNKISSLPEELGSLVNLNLLILRNTRIRTIHQGVIAKLKYLQVLDLCEVWGTEGGNLTYLPLLLFEELECLNDLKGLGIRIEDTSQLNRLIMLPNVSVRWLGISKLEKSTSFSLSTTFLGDDQIQMNLAYLRLFDSHVTQVVIEGDHQSHTWHLQALETLQFDNMDSLKEIIWEGVVPGVLFQALRILSVHGCGMLNDISWILHLPNLRELWISSCTSMRQLITHGADNHGENFADIVDTFSCFHIIFLEDLPELVSIWHSTLALPALNTICIQDCPKLKKLPFLPGNIPSKLQSIQASKLWWESLEWEDSTVKTSLQPLYMENLSGGVIIEI